ncbi:MAG: hypothetical protein EBR09_11755 [Proteobacteria bacterium]|nr:hypothetical protein [Pseudomonadota bacterium]
MPSKIIDLGNCENLIVASDVHMRTPDDPQTQNFMQLLRHTGSSVKCDTLVLLGDIFDFINARQSFYFEHWKSVFLELASLRERGVRVVFAEGNHDFGFEHSPCDAIRSAFDSCGDVVLKVRHARAGEIMLLHSDDVVCPPSYRIFRAVVKSAAFQTLFAPVPGKLTNAIFSKYAKVSRAKDEYRVLDPEFLTRCTSEFAAGLRGSFGFKPDLCVFGHIHVHLDDSLDGIRFLSGPSWLTHPSVLSLNGGGDISRIWLDELRTAAPAFKFSAGGSNVPAKSQK